MQYDTSFIWIFVGAGASFPAGAFSSRPIAEEWIARRGLSGVLTKYPVDVGAFDWAVRTGSFKVKRPEQETPSFVGRFSSAGQEHYHYEDGRLG
jgi:hypothetical protein